MWPFLDVSIYKKECRLCLRDDGSRDTSARLENLRRNVGFNIFTLIFGCISIHVIERGTLKISLSHTLIHAFLVGGWKNGSYVILFYLFFGVNVIYDMTIEGF